MRVPVAGVGSDQDAAVIIGGSPRLQHAVVVQGIVRQLSDGQPSARSVILICSRASRAMHLDAWLLCACVCSMEDNSRLRSCAI